MEVTVFYDLCLQYSILVLFDTNRNASVNRSMTLVNEKKYLITSLTLKAYTIIERQSKKTIVMIIY